MLKASLENRQKKKVYSRDREKKGMITMKASDVKLEILASCNWECSAWNRGVLMYACEILDAIGNKEVTKKNLLNGAKDWNEYSYSGSSLVYDVDICRRLCTPSEVKRTKDGEKHLNKRENWKDVQTRALYQAYHLIMKINEKMEDYELK